MDERIAVLLQNDAVRRELKRTWLDSNPGVFGAHEEGGFICLAADGSSYTVDR